MRTAQRDSGASRATGAVTAAGAVSAFTGLAPVVSKSGTGTYLVRLPGCRTLMAVAVSANANPPWVASGGGAGGDAFGVSTFNSGTAALQDIPFTYVAEYR